MTGMPGRSSREQMRIRAVIAYLSLSTLWVPPLALSFTSRAIAQAVDDGNAAPAIEAPKDNNPCGGHLDSKQKADCFAHSTFSIGTLIGPLFTAVPEFAAPPAGYPRQWRKGPAAFGRVYGDAFALQTVQQTSRFVTGLALHEDLRYYPAASRNPLCRALHAITFAAFDRSDSGGIRLAASNFLGSAAAGFVGTAYLPRGYNDTSHAVTRMGFQFGFIVAENLVNEFRPELRHLQKTLHLAGHRDTAARRGD